MATDIQYLSDSASLKALIDQMPTKDRIEFETYRCRTLESAFQGRVMVIYTLKYGKPDNIEVVKFLDYWHAFQEVPRCRVVYRTREYVLTPVPSRIGDRDIFASIPQNFVMRWAGQRLTSGVQFRPQYAVLLQARSKEEFAVDGDTHCVVLKRFKERWPEYADQTRF